MDCGELFILVSTMAVQFAALIKCIRMEKNLKKYEEERRKRLHKEARKVKR